MLYQCLDDVATSFYRVVGRRGCRRSSSRILEEMRLNRQNCSTKDCGKKLSWKPITLRWPLLMSIVALTLSFIAILEFLSQKSRVAGAVAFTGSQSSSSISSAYLYMPTVIAALYSILWSWIDLDTKRLEPWFQLSTPGGAKATDSLLLHYPHDFLAFAPVKALHKR